MSNSTSRFFGAVEVVATDATLKLPSLTTVQRNTISPLAEGLVVYNNTTGTLELYNGTSWQSVLVTSTGTTFTSGSVIFADASGQMAQNNSNFFWDNSNVRLGIGTNTPSAKLHVRGTVVASGAVSRGEYNATTLVAAANNDVLVGLDVAPTFTNGAFTGVTNYAARFTNDVILKRDYNGTTTLYVENLTSGTASQARLILSSGSGIGSLNKYSPGTTVYKIVNSSDFALYNSTAGDIAVLNDVAAGAIKFAAGASSTSHIYLASTGNVGVGTTTTTTARFTLTGSQTASSAVARGLYNTSTLVAAANGDTLVGLDVAPTFTNGAFTGVTNWGLRVTAGGASIATTTAGATALSVSGTTGTLLTATDTSSGNRVQVNNSSGTTIFTIGNDGTYHPTSVAVSGFSATPTTVISIDKTTGSSAFFDYYVKNTGTGGWRAGTVMAVWDGTNAVYTDTATTDLNASTAALTWSVDISGSNVRLRATLASGTWDTKVGARVI